MYGFGATPTLHFNLDPRLVECLRQQGTWDPSSQTCSVGGGGIPTWAFIAGGALIIGGAAWYLLKK